MKTSWVLSLFENGEITKVWTSDTKPIYVHHCHYRIDDVEVITNQTLILKKCEEE